MGQYEPAMSSLCPDRGPWQQIAEVLGNLSQEVWWSGWMRDVEHITWEWVQHPDAAPTVGRDLAPRLRGLAQEGRHWVRWVDGRGPVPVRLDRWEHRHAKWLLTHPDDAHWLV